MKTYIKKRRKKTFPTNLCLGRFFFGEVLVWVVLSTDSMNACRSWIDTVLTKRGAQKSLGAAFIQQQRAIEKRR
jgi:hypothetical protein